MVSLPKGTAPAVPILKFLIKSDHSYLKLVNMVFSITAMALQFTSEINRIIYS